MTDLTQLIRESYLGRVLGGKAPLWLVFWPLGVGVLLILVPLLDNSDIRLMADASSPYAVFSAIVLFIIHVLVWIGIWRCAFNVKWRGWGWIARILLILMIVHSVRAYLLVPELTI